MEELAFMERVVLIVERSIPVSLAIEVLFWAWLIRLRARRRK